jgi:hypothetical protein
MRWFVLVYWLEHEVTPEKAGFRYLRAYTWQDARDQLVPERLNHCPWTLAPLEADGTYWTGTAFVECRDMPSVFVKEERE